MLLFILNCVITNAIDLHILKKNFFIILFVTFLQVIEITDYRSQLYDYLKSRMMTVAPNLTVLVGEFVGARLVAQAGNCLVSFILKCCFDMVFCLWLVLSSPQVHFQSPSAYRLGLHAHCIDGAHVVTLTVTVFSP